VLTRSARLPCRRFRQLPQYRARPSALLPLWSGAAYALGAASGLLGREAAYAVTEAVEEVITQARCVHAHAHARAHARGARTHRPA
jgi:ubiquinone biosynthesis monooxygenase Coq7